MALIQTVGICETESVAKSRIAAFRRVVNFTRAIEIEDSELKNAVSFLLCCWNFYCLSLAYKNLMDGTATVCHINWSASIDK